jgi:hypothetical protein
MTRDRPAGTEGPDVSHDQGDDEQMPIGAAFGRRFA